MEVMQHLRAEVEKKKEVLHHFKEDLEEVVEEALSKHRRRSTTTRTTSDGSTITTVSSTSCGESNGTSSASDISVDLDASKIEGEGQCLDEQAGDDDKDENSVYFDKTEGGGTGVEWSHFNVKADDLAAKLKDVDVNQVLSAVISSTQVENLKDKLLLGSNLPTSMKPHQKEDSISSTGLSNKGPETAATYELEESDEEVVELEFETAVQKMHSNHDYNMHCPNCSSRITKVVLRRKIKQRRVPVLPDSERRDLFGCLSCFGIFARSGNRLNPFRIFGAGRDRESTQLLQQQQTSDVIVTTSGSTQVTGRGFDPFGFFRKGKDKENDLTSPLLTAAVIEPTSTSVTYKPRDEAIEQGLDTSQQAKDNNNAEIRSSGDNIVTNSVSVGEQILGKLQSDGVAGVVAIGSVNQTSPPPQGSKEILNGVTQPKMPLSEIEGEINTYFQPKDILNGVKQFIQPIVRNTYYQPEGILNGVKQPMQPILEIKGVRNTYYQPEGGDVRIPIEETPEGTGIIPQLADTATDDAARPLIATESESSRSVEIVKSVVYGGLMESITSLGVVASAAASDATSLNIVALGLANLVGGLVVLAHNLKDLRYAESSETNEQKYKEQLGRKEHFLMHATLAVLSYIVFGLIPPVIYGFTFRESDDRDFKLLAVAAASFVCIVILAIGKAYIRGEHKFMAYFKTVLYYVTSAVMVSGVAYAVGDLVKKLVERLGWLDPATTVKPKSFHPTWASY